MILGGGSNCQGCGCGGTCEACTRTCQNPHSGAAFQEVYRGYSFGAVNGLATDGYLTFSGDEDNPAFIPGGGPFHQAIGGSFYLSSAQTRFPCSFSVSFWRTLFPADATTDTALSSNTVTFTCVSGQFFLPTVGVTLNPGDTYTFSNAVPLVSLFSGDPRSSVGSFGGFALCDNTQIGVQARIDWSSSERIHVLHGIVRECYEEGTPCATSCSGNPPPSSLYLTISNVAVTSGTFVGTFPNGTYVLGRVPFNCNAYVNRATGNCSLGPGYWADYQSVNAGSSLNSGVVSFDIASFNDGLCGDVHFDAIDSRLLAPCGTGVIANGSASWSWYMPTSRVVYLGPAFGTLDWKVEA